MSWVEGVGFVFVSGFVGVQAAKRERLRVRVCDDGPRIDSNRVKVALVGALVVGGYDDDGYGFDI